MRRDYQRVPERTLTYCGIVVIASFCCGCMVGAGRVRVAVDSSSPRSLPCSGGNNCKRIPGNPAYLWKLICDCLTSLFFFLGVCRDSRTFVCVCVCARLPPPLLKEGRPFLRFGSPCAYTLFWLGLYAQKLRTAAAAKEKKTI